jgi:aryl-alcohol dehydrogenase-like predicted oxidoreductase
LHEKVKTMNYNKYSNNETLVSEIGLGGAQLGLNAASWSNLLEQSSIHMVHQALELGVNFFDTAPIYGHGLSEIRLGKALKKTNRSKVVINTKFGSTDTGKLNFNAN